MIIRKMLAEADGVIHSYDERYESIIKSDDKHIFLETESMQIKSANEVMSIEENGTIRTQDYKFRLVALNVITGPEKKDELQHKVGDYVIVSDDIRDSDYYSYLKRLKGLQLKVVKKHPASKKYTLSYLAHGIVRGYDEKPFLFSDEDLKGFK